MDADRFDTLTRALMSGGSRRAAVSSLLAGLLGLLTLAETVAAKKGRAEGKKQDDTKAEACIPTGKKCPSPKPRGRKRNGKNGKKAKQLSCNNCCQRRVVKNTHGQNVCHCAPEGDPCTETRECCDGRCIGGVCSIGATGALPAGAVILPQRCNLPLQRGLATQGGGTAGTNQCAVADGCRQTVQINLQGATPHTGFDVYIDQDSMGNRAHKFAGTFTTDAAGNAFFQNTIVVSDAAIVPGPCPSKVDNELVLAGTPYEKLDQHQFIQESFTPCPFC